MQYNKCPSVIIRNKLCHVTHRLPPYVCRQPVSISPKITMTVHVDLRPSLSHLATVVDRFLLTNASGTVCSTTLGAWPILHHPGLFPQLTQRCVSGWVIEAKRGRQFGKRMCRHGNELCVTIVAWCWLSIMYLTGNSAAWCRNFPGGWKWLHLTSYAPLHYVNHQIKKTFANRSSHVT